MCCKYKVTLRSTFKMSYPFFFGMTQAQAVFYKFSFITCLYLAFILSKYSFISSEWSSCINEYSWHYSFVLLNFDLDHCRSLLNWFKIDDIVLFLFLLTLCAERNNNIFQLNLIICDMHETSSVLIVIIKVSYRLIEFK